MAGVLNHEPENFSSFVHRLLFGEASTSMRIRTYIHKRRLMYCTKGELFSGSTSSLSNYTMPTAKTCSRRSAAWLTSQGGPPQRRGSVCDETALGRMAGPPGSAAGDCYPGNQDPHKSLQPIRSSNSRSRLPRDQRSTTESTEIHGKENPNQLPVSVSFPGATPARRVGRSMVTRL